MKSLLIATALFLVSQIAFSKPLQLANCENVGATIENILLGAQNQKSYYQGVVGLVAYDTIEPAAAPYGIAVLHNEPTMSAEGFIVRKCLAVPYLSAVDLKNAKSSYDPKTGVTVIVPAQKMDGITGLARNAKIQINIRTVNKGQINEGHRVTAEEL